jgi:hypothetical protein
MSAETSGGARGHARTSVKTGSFGATDAKNEEETGRVKIDYIALFDANGHRVSCLALLRLFFETPP